MISNGVSASPINAQSCRARARDQRRAGEDDGQHGDAVDEFHDRANHTGSRFGLKRARTSARRQGCGRAMALHEGRHLGTYDVMHIAVADEGLATCGWHRR